MTKAPKMTFEKLEQNVVDTVLADLENGELSVWKKEWLSGGLPKNYFEDREYNGGNVLILLMERMRKGYKTNLWVTAPALIKNNNSWEKGSKATYITKPLVGKDKETGEKEFKGWGCQAVFNIDQTDIELPEIVQTPQGETNEQAEKIIDQMSKEVTTTYSGDQAFYNRMSDKVTLPENFKTMSGKYSTAFHEYGHSTMHKSRLDREANGKFGSPEYAREELIAEMASAFLCAHTQVKGKLQHSEYIDHWIKLLKEDKKALFRASTKADKASKYIRGIRE